MATTKNTTSKNSTSTRKAPAARKSSKGKAAKGGNGAASTDATPEAEPSNSEMMAKLPTHKRVEVRLRNMGNRLTSYVAKAQKWELPEMEAQVKAAMAALEGAAKVIEELPADWAAPTARKGGGPGKVKLEKGARVDFREKHKAEYARFLDADDLVGLEVVEVHPKHVMVQRNTDPSKDPIPVPRGYVQLAKADAAPAE